jgi:GGDEF domain-containing protein
LIYAPNCDTEGAVKRAEAILSILSGEGMLLARTPFSVSIGIAVCDGDGADFARMHREAEAALQRARSEGRNRIGVAPSSEACQTLEAEAAAT